MAKYGRGEQYRAFRIYEESGRNMSEVARQPNLPSRPTLYEWRRKGFPIEETGGLHWDQFLDKKEREQLEVTRQREVAERQENDLNFIDDAKDKLRNAFDTVYNKIQSDAFTADPSQLTNLVQMYIKLDNQAADKIEFMKSVHTVYIGIAMEIMDDAQIARYKSMLARYQQQQIEKMGDIPNKQKLLQ